MRIARFNPQTRGNSPEKMDENGLSRSVALMHFGR